NVGLSPATLAFPSQNDGTTSSPLNLTVTNTGNSTLNVSGVTITGTNSADFAQTNTCASVAPQATCTVSVTFTPTLVGSESANLSITDDAPHSPHVEPVTGTGVTSGGPFVVLSPTSLKFATLLVGTTSASQNVTLSNTGSGTLNITSLTSTGDYKQTNTCGSSVASGASCTITVTFTPKSINLRNGTITIADNATGSPQTVALSGK